MAPPQEFKVKLPTEKAWGIPPKNYLYYTIRPYDVYSKYVQCLEPTEDAPGLSITCGLCGKELLNHLHIDGGLPCFSTHQITRVVAPRFCLEAMARAAYDAWGIEYDYEAYLREKNRLEREHARAAEFMEQWIKSLEKLPQVEPYEVNMGITADNHIVYVVSRKKSNGK